MALHDQVLDLADKSVAHCVDGSEENFAYVLIGPPDENMVSINLSVLSGNVSHHNKIDAVAFANLAVAVKAIARAEADRVALEVMDRLEAGGESGLAALPQISRGITEEGEALTDRYRRQVKA